MLFKWMCMWRFVAAAQGSKSVPWHLPVKSRRHQSSQQCCQLSDAWRFMNLNMAVHLESVMEPFLLELERPSGRLPGHSASEPVCRCHTWVYIPCRYLQQPSGRVLLCHREAETAPWDIWVVFAWQHSELGDVSLLCRLSLNSWKDYS